MKTEISLCLKRHVVFQGASFPWLSSWNVTLNHTVRLSVLCTGWFPRGNFNLFGTSLYKTHALLLQYFCPLSPVNQEISTPSNRRLNTVWWDCLFAWFLSNLNAGSRCLLGSSGALDHLRTTTAMSLQPQSLHRVFLLGRPAMAW